MRWKLRCLDLAESFHKIIIFWWKVWGRIGFQKYSGGVNRRGSDRLQTVSWTVVRPMGNLSIDPGNVGVMLL